MLDACRCDWSIRTGPLPHAVKNCREGVKASTLKPEADICTTSHRVCKMLHGIDTARNWLPARFELLVQKCAT